MSVDKQQSAWYGCPRRVVGCVCVCGRGWVHDMGECLVARVCHGPPMWPCSGNTVATGAVTASLSTNGWNKMNETHYINNGQRGDSTRYAPQASGL
eukprot:m.369750 g.369750  ORF g.369750 m.369750 type:complete len:96 (+) comp28125_c0_seq2:1875-2162(+)